MASYVRRRDFITLVGGAAAAWPFDVCAQQPKLPVIGFLQVGIPFAYALTGFRQGLKDAGLVEGQNFSVEYRWANNDETRLPELAAQLVRRQVDVIVTIGSTAAVLAIKAATGTIPIVFGTGADPVQAGLVASLARPGGNIVGVSSMSGELGGKQIGLIRELLPHATRFGVLTVRSAVGTDLVENAKTAAEALSVQFEIFYADSNGEIDIAFADIVRKRTEALLVGASLLFVERRIQIATLAARHGLPVAYPFREYLEVGGLMVYGPNLAERDRQVGIYTGRILKGEKPADLPVMRSTKFEFILNLQTAKTLAIVIPPTLLASADEVIE